MLAVFIIIIIIIIIIIDFERKYEKCRGGNSLILHLYLLSKYA